MCVIYFIPPVSPNGSVRAQSSINNTRRGDVVELSCLTEGGPGNEFVWILDGTVLANLPNFHRNISSSLDGGFYQCQVENEAGVGIYSLAING